MTEASATKPSSPTTITKPGMSNCRWIICALLFFATVIAYIDRGVIGYLESFLEKEIGWNSVQYGWMTAAFQAAYAIGMVLAGGITDKLGTRKGFAVAITLWSAAAMLPSLAHSALAFGVALFFIGLGEAANFPACIKTVAEWFPKKERALATGIFNSGANIGNIAVPLLVPVLTLAFGWRMAFVVTGATGLIWLVFWLWLYKKPEDHKWVSSGELAHIQCDPDEEKIERVPWAKVLPKKETWAFAIGKFLTDPIWWFYLFWLPRYLQNTYHLSLSQSRTPVAVVYAVSCIGSIGGGWISSFFLKQGMGTNAARKITMLICALAVVPVLYAPYAHSLWLVVGLVGVATAAHQGWSANIFTLPSDMFPKAAVGSVVGIGGFTGACGGVLMQLGAGYVVAITKSYIPLFVVACSAYVLALIIIHLITPKLKPAHLEL